MARQQPRATVTLTGTTLTVSMAPGNAPSIAHIRITSAQQTPNFAISAAPASLSVQQGNQGTSAITTTISGGFNSAISLSASGVPSGTTVSFNPQTIPAPGAGSSTMTITVGSSTSVGTYPITVTGNGGGIQQNTTVTLTVTAAVQSDFVLTVSPSAVFVPQGLVGNATVTTWIVGSFNSSISLSASAVPSGTTVSFNPQTIPAPGAGNSTMTFTVGSGTPTGSYPITVTGKGGGTQHTVTVNLVVTAQGAFTMSASPASLSIAQGNQGTSTITTAVSSGFNGSISLSASGMPSGTTVSFNPGTIPAPGAGNSTMTITVGLSTPVGTYPIVVTGNGGGIQQNTTVTLTVTAQGQPNFTISASPASLSVQQGNQGASTITTTIGGGFNSSISLSASGMPTGNTVSFNPQTIPAPGTGNSTMTITVGSSTPLGTYPITVTGTGGGLAPTAAVSLTVIASGGPGNGITVSDLSGSGQTNRFVSVGRFFSQGDIPHFAQAIVGGTPILTQCDVKNRWSDGSLKFAIISFVLPSVSTSGTAVGFQDQATGNNTGFLQQADMLNNAYDFDAVMQLNGTVSPTTSARSMLQGGQFRYWLQGPIVTAVIIEDRDGRSYDVNTDGAAGNPLHPIYEAWFYPQGNKVEVGFTLENSWSSSTATSSARNQTFSLTLSTGHASPAIRLSQASFTEWAFTRWRRAFWVDSDPAPIQIDWNPQYLLATSAYPAYDVNYLPLSNGLLTAVYKAYTDETTNYPARLTIPGFDDPNHGGIVNYDQAIDATGDGEPTSWIGLFPTWDIDYLLSGDPHLQQMMTDNADLAGRFPMWFREADHHRGIGKVLRLSEYGLR